MDGWSLLTRPNSFPGDNDGTHNNKLWESEEMGRGRTIDYLSTLYFLSMKMTTLISVYIHIPKKIKNPPK